MLTEMRDDKHARKQSIPYYLHRIFPLCASLNLSATISNVLATDQTYIYCKLSAALCCFLCEAMTQR